MNNKRFAYKSLLNRNYKRGCLLLPLLLLVIVWSLLPMVRAITLVGNVHQAVEPSSAHIGFPIQEVHFTATDNVHLAGWLTIASPRAPTIILVHGFKGSRLDMLLWARFLYAGGYNVLLFDSRGCGESEGWSIALGAREADDVLGAVHYLQGRSDLLNKRLGTLGMSLGAGVVLLAAAHEPALLATVADSAWADESAQVSRMGSIGRLPVLPYEPALVDALIQAHLADARPIAVIHQIAPRALFLIHSADDRNATTPLQGEQELYAAAGAPKQQWIAPSGGHVGAISAHKAEYEQRVLAFFARYLKSK